MTVPTPGPEPLHGYRLRDYDDLIGELQAGEWPMVGSLGLRMADALGYDLALIPREEP